LIFLFSTKTEKGGGRQKTAGRTPNGVIGVYNTPKYFKLSK